MAHQIIYFNARIISKMDSPVIVEDQCKEKFRICKANALYLPCCKEEVPFLRRR
jgi:hypothetical protein